MTADCARAGKHVVCEKPLAMTIEECEQMIHVTRQAGVLLLYAEELFFTPKYLKAKEMADDGGVRQNPPGETKRKTFWTA